MGRVKPGSLLYRRPDDTEEHILLNADVTTFGRSDSCNVVVPLPTVSRLHATIELQHGRYILSDMGSANGTFVNGERIGEPTQLSTNDRIWLGSEHTVLNFSDPEETVAIQFHRPPAPLYIDDKAHVVHVHGVLCNLSPQEYSLLLYLARNPGTVCTRNGCFMAVWGRSYDHATCEDALNACVAKLRTHLRTAADEADESVPAITTVPRVGFRLDAEVVFGAQSGQDELLQMRTVGV